jgi:hypothetical protein
MKYVVEMGSAAMIYIPSFTKIGSRIQELIGEYTYEGLLEVEVELHAYLTSALS